MNHILRPTKDPLGGNQALYFIPDEDITSIDTAADNAVSIDYVGSKKFYELEYVHATCKCEYTGVKTALGKLYDIQVFVIVAGNFNDNEAILEEMLDYKFILARKDNNCNITILGNTEQPLTYSILYNSEATAGKMKSTQISFIGQCYMPEKLLSGSLLINA